MIPGTFPLKIPCSIFSVETAVYCKQEPFCPKKKGRYPMALQTYEKEHIRRLRKLLPECTVLLKRDGRFPLDAPGEIALFGSGARNTVFGGTGSGEVNSRFRISDRKSVV